MTVQQAIKKYKLTDVSFYFNKVKCKELNVDNVLYMAEGKNKKYYIVEVGPKRLLYKQEKPLMSSYWKPVQTIELQG